MMYMGYKIERVSPVPPNWNHKKWGIFCEHHDYGRVTWKPTAYADTIEEAKYLCRGHFGRI